MGKTNKANRTKGNTRPSSSGHSAELLGNALSGFIGFGALEKETPSYVPATGQHVADATDSTVDSDFRMVMRKMLKKDAVTRLKAVQEFGEHCDEKDKEIVKNVLPFWPRLFNKFALDCDRRIREATHHANGKLLSKVRREMAPYLKGIMGVWLLGQCDLYAPAASAAQSTFANTFPEAKQSEALLFCKNEMFAYFKDNLFEQTAKTMSEPSVTSAEDMESKYVLVISGTLQGLKFFLTSVQKSDDSSILENFSSIIAENKFWKLAKAQDALIRGSWYTLVSSLCQLKPDLFKEMEKKLATTVFTCLSESDPMVAPAVWECALSIVVHFENYWQSVNVHKIVLPQLWILLKEGGRGNARVLFPCLLPFLSKLPKDVLESETFLLQFFACFKQSLMLQNVKMSAIECESILKAFFECLQFMCCTRLVNDATGPDLLQKVLLSEVIPMVETSLYDNQGRHISASNLYQLLGSLIQKLESLSKESNERISEAFSNIIHSFWNEMLPILSKIFNSTKNPSSTSLVYISYFFNSILQAEESCLKLQKKRSVRFKDGDDDNEEECDKTDITTTASELTKKTSISFAHFVKFSELLCDNITVKYNTGFVQLLEEILSSASSRDFVQELLKTKSDEQQGVPSSEPVYDFVRTVMLGWMEKELASDGSVDSVINIVFILCGFASEAEATNILNCCCQGGTVQTEYVLKKGLESHRKSFFFQIWLKSSKWSSTILHDLELLVEKKKFVDTVPAVAEIQVYHRLLSTCLSDPDTSLLIDNEAFKKIVLLLQQLTHQMSSEEFKNQRIDFALNFIHDITIAVLKNPELCWKFEATETLLYHLFQISLFKTLKYSEKSSHLFYNIFDACIDSYLKIREEVLSEKSVIHKMATELNHVLLSLSEFKQTTRVHEHCTFLLSTVQKYLAIHDPELSSTDFVAHKLLETILPSPTAWDALKEGLTINLLPLYMKKKLFYPLRLDETFEYSATQANKLHFASDAVFHVLVSGLTTGCPGTEMDAKEEFFTRYFCEHLPYVLWSLTFSNLTQKVSVPSKREGKEGDWTALLSLVPDKIKNTLRENLLLLSLDHGHWALCLQTFEETLSPSYLKDIDEEQLLKLAAGTEEIILHISVPDHWGKKFTLHCLRDIEFNKNLLAQVLINHLPTDKKMIYLKQVLNKLTEDMSTIDETYLSKVGEICCCLQDADALVLDVEVQKSLYALFRHLALYNSSETCNYLETSNLQVSSILSSQIQFVSNFVDKEIWDALCSLLTGLLKECQLNDLDTPKNCLLLFEATRLFTSCSQLLAEVTGGPWTPAPLSKENLRDVVNVYFHATDAVSELISLPEMCSMALTQLVEAVIYIPFADLAKMLFCPHEERFPFFEKVIQSFTSRARPIQFATHLLLIKVVPILPDVLEKMPNLHTRVVDETDEDIEKIPKVLNTLIDSLLYLNEVVESMLLDVKIGDPCTLIPHTDSYHMALTYLLNWFQMLNFFTASPSQILLGYATHLEEKKLLSSVFSNVFRLLPENPVACLKSGKNIKSPEKEDLKELFLHAPDIIYGQPSPEEIQILACHIFCWCLQIVPASIRTWWNNLDRKSADIVDEYTTKYISGFICYAEIRAVQAHEDEFQNLQIQTRPGSREVIATYTIDDCAIELRIQLPPNYPLSPIAAERKGRVVVGQNEWRQWLMQLITVLTYQNGSILDGLKIWLKNIEKKFEGVEECMICYYILHSTTLKLPKLSCHVCKKKFHSACLYKWFRTSNNFTCPLCRNEFLV